MKVLMGELFEMMILKLIEEKIHNYEKLLFG
jgi:hypothetical protein